MASPARWRIAVADVDLASEIVEAAVQAVANQMQLGALTRETGVTGALVAELNRRFGGAQSPTGGIFRARELRLREEAATGADILFVFVTPYGVKWTQVQAKLGERIASEWGRLASECSRMRRHGSSRVLVYYEDQFIAADGKKIPSPALRPPQRKRIGSTQLGHWFHLSVSMRYFFRCWGGSRRHIPRAIDAQLVLFVGYEPGDSVERFDSLDLIGRIEAFLSGPDDNRRNLRDA